jgi:hypothetical protein
MFRAVSHWKYANQNQHVQVRKDLHQYAKSHIDIVEEEMRGRQVPKPASQWIDEMSRLRVWGDSTAFILLASCYNVIFFVVTSKHGRASAREYHPVQRSQYSRTDVYFILLEDSHFEIINPFEL